MSLARASSSFAAWSTDSPPDTARSPTSLTWSAMRSHSATLGVGLTRSSWSRNARAFHAQLDRVRSPPKVPEWERIAQEMRLAAERAIQRQMSIDEALTALDAKTDAILEKRRWMLARGGPH